MDQLSLEINESLYRALFEQTNDGVFILGLDFRYIAANQMAASMLGYTVDELVGMSVNDVIALQELDEGQNGTLYNDVGMGQPVYERTFKRKDGTTFPVEISTSLAFTEQGLPSHIQSIVRDITERKTAEQSLLLSEQRYKAIVDALPDLVLRLDSTGKILDFSANEKHPLHQNPKKVIGKRIDGIWPKKIANKWLDVIAEAIRTQTQQIIEETFPEDQRTYEIRINQIGQNETLTIIRDISSRIRLEQMKTDFINRASHELRTPITTALLMTELIRDGGDPEEIEEFWQILENELNRQKILIDRFLMAGRMESNNLVIDPIEMDLIPVIQESISAVSPMAKMKQIKIVLNITEDIPKVWGETAGLQQVFINLINNSVKYSPTESQVSVTVRILEPWVEVEIADQGMGIPEKEIPHLFERFYRARNVSIAEIPGSGLGLYLVKSIVDELDGEIAVVSEAEQGTKFKVRLKIT